MQFVTFWILFPLLNMTWAFRGMPFNNSTLLCSCTNIHPFSSPLFGSVCLFQACNKEFWNGSLPAALFNFFSSSFFIFYVLCHFLRSSLSSPWYLGTKLRAAFLLLSDCSHLFTMPKNYFKCWASIRSGLPNVSWLSRAPPASFFPTESEGSCIDTLTQVGVPILQILPLAKIWNATALHCAVHSCLPWMALLNQQ